MALILLNLGQKAKMTEVNPQDGYPEGRADTPGSQHGSITAQSDEQVKFPCPDALDEGRVLERAPGYLFHTTLFEKPGDFLRPGDPSGNVDVRGNGNPLWNWE